MFLKERTSKVKSSPKTTVAKKAKTVVKRLSEKIKSGSNSVKAGVKRVSAHVKANKKVYASAAAALVAIAVGSELAYRRSGMANDNVSRKKAVKNLIREAKEMLFHNKSRSLKKADSVEDISEAYKSGHEPDLNTKSNRKSKKSEPELEPFSLKKKIADEAKSMLLSKGFSSLQSVLSDNVEMLDKPKQHLGIHVKKADDKKLVRTKKSRDDLQEQLEDRSLFVNEMGSSSLQLKDSENESSNPDIIFTADDEEIEDILNNLNFYEK
jgi:hypothetical protein